MVVQLIRWHEQLLALSLPEQRRSKRAATIDQVSTVIAGIQQDLQVLEQNLHRNRNSSKEQNTPATEENVAKCAVQADGGGVNCTTIIYEDEKSWKRSRQQIDLLIKVLKRKIVDLKDIKRHLKEHKPTNVKDDYEEEETVSKEEEELGPLINMSWYTTRGALEWTTSTMASVSTSSALSNASHKNNSSSTSARKGPKATRKPNPMLTTNPRKGTTAATALAESSAAIEKEQKKIPIFYIGEDSVSNESVQVGSCTTTGAPSTLAVNAIPTEASAFVSSFTTTTTSLDSSTALDKESVGVDGSSTAVHSTTTQRGTDSTIPSDNRTDATNKKTVVAPAECYCDIEDDG